MAAKRPRDGYETFDVLILDAGYKQTLASARSLGRAGLRVALGESVAEYRPPVPLPAFASRYCAHRLVLPNYADDARGFADTVLDFVGEHRIQVVLPTGDAASAALVPFREELAKLGCTLALAPDAALEIANDKARTLEIALELGIPVPRSLPVGGIDDLPSVVAGLGFPFVLKPTISWTGKTAERVVPIEVVTMAEAIQATERFLAAEAGLLAQQWASGRREGVTLFIQDGNVVASYGHVEHRTTPALGGASVVRESIQAPRDVLDAAVRLAKAVGMQGVCAVEFRRDADNRPLLMEINPRLVSTTGNAIQSGIDLPLMIWQWATGMEVKPVASHRAGVRTRWLRGDIRWLMENQGRLGRPDSEPKLRSFWIFASEFIRTWRYDYLDVQDFQPAIAELRSIAATTRRVVRNKSAALSTARREQVVKTVNALVIGAGPFGLSISAHLRGRGVDHMIVGRPVDTWRSHMPLGMNLKSEPYGSVISAPSTGFDIATYCASKGFEYVHRAGPLALERFLGYADWFTEQLVPDVRDEMVTEVVQADDGFRVTFAEAEPVSARQVVIATGVLPYARVPAEFTGMPKDLVTHTADHHLLDKFAGRRVAVIGSGQSALETAALAHEQGADVVIVARTPKLVWADHTPEHLTLLRRVRRPVNRLCETWRCAAWNSPTFFRTLPEDMRVTRARTVLGPSGSWWLKDRVEGVIEVLTSHHVKEAAPQGSGVRLTLNGPKQAPLDVDHVICGTGFPIEIARLPFLPVNLRERMTTVKGYPVLSRAGESSIPGLYFAGAPASASLGPSLRFIAGTHNLPRWLAAEVSRKQGR